MKVLFISDLNPFEGYTGTQQRTNLIYRSLCEISEVDILIFSDNQILCDNYGDGQMWIYRKEIDNQPYSMSDVGYIFPRSNLCSEKVSELYKLYGYDFIFVRYLEMVYVCGLENHPRLVVDIDDLPSQKYVSRSKSLGLKKKLSYRIKSILAHIYTKRVIDTCHHAFLSNPNQIISNKTSCLRNIPYPFFQSDVEFDVPFEKQENAILFVGMMSYYPNYEGVDFFLKNIWNQVLEQNPNAVFKIIGKGLPEDYLIRWSTYRNVIYMGFVEDVLAEYQKVKLVLIPMFQGAGTNIKVLEAMNVGKACIVSKYASRGFEDLLVNKKNVIIADSMDDYLSGIDRLLHDKEFNISLSQSALRTVREKYSFDFFKREIISRIS